VHIYPSEGGVGLEGRVGREERGSRGNICGSPGAGKEKDQCTLPQLKEKWEGKKNGKAISRKEKKRRRQSGWGKCCKFLLLDEFKVGWGKEQEPSIKLHCIGLTDPWKVEWVKTRFAGTFTRKKTLMGELGREEMS